jgi:threonine dehydratase
VDLADVFAARRRIAPYLRRTPLVESGWLSDRTGSRAYLKLESLQQSYSFKSRGAFNAVIARLERGSAPARIVTASAGNHGRALAAACEQFRLPLVVFTPIDAPNTKLSAITRHGAELRSEGRDYDDAEKRALAFARDTGAEFISPYNDADVIAGAGTVALELFEDAGSLDAVVVPIGGGGLVSGVAIASKAIAPSCTVIGVEAEASCAFLTSVQAGRLVEIVPGPTIADGLGGNPDPQTITFGFIQKLVDHIVTVSEDDLSGAIAALVESEHVIAEGAGAAAVAAVASGRVDVRGRRVAVLLTGGNIDRGRLAALLR